MQLMPRATDGRFDGVTDLTTYHFSYNVHTDAFGASKNETIKTNMAGSIDLVTSDNYNVGFFFTKGAISPKTCIGNVRQIR